ncbi:putative polygalacturonase [Panicum miliaceum]|uniref:Polygalacturonase n=1 Tax=Panicum miliaceum TaxID=4540 RepID=A0A3L6TG97_PANMI|nr:putative polygalacturonase [Panicum miliaceum]
MVNRSNRDSVYSRMTLLLCARTLKWVASPPVNDLREFGVVRDERTMNTAAFEAAVVAIAKRGGGRLTVPAGRWLTVLFNFTSRMTLFLATGAEILGIQGYSRS